MTDLFGGQYREDEPKGKKEKFDEAAAAEKVMEKMRAGWTLTDWQIAAIAKCARGKVPLVMKHVPGAKVAGTYYKTIAWIRDDVSP